MSMSSVMFEYCSSMSLQVMQQATRTSLSINPIIHLIFVYVWIALKTAEVCICFFFLCGSHALFTGPTSMDFNKFFFKTGSHGTIHIFKNYFATVFLVFSNKRYPKRPYMGYLKSIPRGGSSQAWWISTILEASEAEIL